MKTNVQSKKLPERLYLERQMKLGPDWELLYKNAVLYRVNVRSKNLETYVGDVYMAARTGTCIFEVGNPGIRHGVHMFVESTPGCLDQAHHTVWFESANVEFAREIFTQYYVSKMNNRNIEIMKNIENFVEENK